MTCILKLIFHVISTTKALGFYPHEIFPGLFSLLSRSLVIQHARKRHAPGKKNRSSIIQKNGKRSEAPCLSQNEYYQLCCCSWLFVTGRCCLLIIVTITILHGNR